MVDTVKHRWYLLNNYCEGALWKWRDSRSLTPFTQGSSLCPKLVFFAFLSTLAFQVQVDREAKPKNRDKRENCLELRELILPGIPTSTFLLVYTGTTTVLSLCLP